MNTPPDDLGKRVAAARAMASIDRDTLADSTGMTSHVLQRIESGLEDLDDSGRRAIIGVVAAATRLPEQFFTVDYWALDRDTPPEDKLNTLERKIDMALARMDEVVREAEGQMTRGKDQLDRFIEVQARDREIMRRVAAHLGIDPG